MCRADENHFIACLQTADIGQQNEIIPGDNRFVGINRYDRVRRGYITRTIRFNTDDYILIVTEIVVSTAGTAATEIEVRQTVISIVFTGPTPVEVEIIGVIVPVTNETVTSVTIFTCSAI